MSSRRNASTRCTASRQLSPSGKRSSSESGPSFIQLLPWDAVQQAVVALTQALLPEDGHEVSAKTISAVSTARPRSETSSAAIPSLRRRSPSCRARSSPTIGQLSVDPACGSPQLVVLTQRVRLEHDANGHTVTVPASLEQCTRGAGTRLRRSALAGELVRLDPRAVADTSPTSLMTAPGRGATGRAKPCYDQGASPLMRRSIPGSCRSRRPYPRRLPRVWLWPPRCQWYPALRCRIRGAVRRRLFAQLLVVAMRVSTRVSASGTRSSVVSSAALASAIVANARNRVTLRFGRSTVRSHAAVLFAHPRIGPGPSHGPRPAPCGRRASCSGAAAAGTSVATLTEQRMPRGPWTVSWSVKNAQNSQSSERYCRRTA